LNNKVSAIENQSVMDLSTQEHLSVEHSFDISVANNWSLTNNLTPGEVYIIPESDLEKVTNSNYFKNANYKVATVANRDSVNSGSYYTIENPYKELLTFVIYNQSTLDITQQESGTIESLFEYLIDENISLSEAPLVGSQVRTTFKTIDSEIKNYYKKRNIKPATYYPIESLLQTLFEAGLFETGLFE
jgi:hypothetical protein